MCAWLFDKNAYSLRYLIFLHVYLYFNIMNVNEISQFFCMCAFHSCKLLFL